MTKESIPKAVLPAFITITLILVLIPVSSSDLLNTKGVTVMAPAVAAGKEIKGAMINITVYVTPGEGRVFVSTEPFTQIDMQGSATLASTVACDILGLDFNRYDFFFVIRAPTPVVGGPSAGGIMTVAVMSALLNKTPNSSVTMTGMILPDGSIGPVGGIPYKLEAAKDVGKKIFLIPEGQRVVMKEKREVVEKGPFVFVKQTSEPVDLVEYGNELGVRVLEVSDITHAFMYFTGLNISREVSHGGIESKEYTEISRMMADEMMKYTDELLNASSGIKIPERSRQLIDEAKKEYNEGRYYSSTSLLLNARIGIRQAMYEEKIKDLDDLQKEMDSIQGEIDNLKDELKNMPVIGITGVQLKGSAENRLYLAINYLESARSSQDIATAIRYLALAKERVVTAKIWLKPYSGMLKNAEKSMDESFLRDRAGFYISQALALNTYARSIGGQQDLISASEDSISLARELFADGFYSGSIISSVSGITEASVSIEIIGLSEDRINEKIIRAKSQAEEAIISLKEEAEPIVPLSYYEFANTSSGFISKLIYYRSATQMAKVLMFLERGNISVNIKPASITIPEQKIKTPVTPGENINVSLPGFSALMWAGGILLVLSLRKRFR